MRRKIYIFFSIFCLITFKCKKTDYNQFLLLSDLEAPLGWQYFTIFKDSTFKYTNRGITREGITNYKGKIAINKDTIFLKYFGDSIPFIRKRVLLYKDSVEFLDVGFPLKVRFKTRLNKLKLE